MDIKKTSEEEILKYLDNPRTGLKNSSDTNKTRYGILGIVEEAIKTQEQEHQKKLEELEVEINNLDENIKHYSDGEYRANFRSEVVLLVKEIFNKNKTI